MLVVQSLLLNRFMEIQIFKGLSTIDTEASRAVRSADESNKKMNEYSIRLGIGFFVCFLILILTKNSVLVEITGTLASLFEGAVPVPQFYNNWKTKSVVGLR